MEHAVHAPEWAAAVEASWIGVAMRQSLWAYPVANLSHLLGLTLLVGPILLFDLRVMGVGRAFVGVEALSRLVTPFVVAGALLAIATGPLLFAADAKALATNSLLLAKLALVLFALANAAVFRSLYGGSLARWDDQAAFWGRAQAAASILAWLTVAGLGRMIAYL